MYAIRSYYETFRDGESEFYINRVPCRLKDIAELFLDTGAGARGYAIIEQGKIMTVVNARPDEKRMIIRITSYNVCYTKLLRHRAGGWCGGRPFRRGPPGGSRESPPRCGS